MRFGRFQGEAQLFNMPSRSLQNVEYFAFSDDSSMITSKRFPVLLKPCTKPTKAANNKERSHRMLIWVARVVRS